MFVFKVIFTIIDILICLVFIDAHYSSTSKENRRAYKLYYVLFLGNAISIWAT